MVVAGELKRPVQAPGAGVERLQRGRHLHALEFGDRFGEIERRGKAVLLLGIWLLELVTQSQVQSQVLADLEIVIDVCPVETSGRGGDNQAGHGRFVAVPVAGTGADGDHCAEQERSIGVAGHGLIRIDISRISNIPVEPKAGIGLLQDAGCMRTQGFETGFQVVLAALLRDLGVKSVAERALVPGSPARTHIDPAASVTADRHTRGQHRNTGVGIQRFVERLIRVQSGEGPVLWLGPVARSIHKVVIVAANADYRGGAQGVSGARRKRIAIPFAAPVRNEDRRTGGIGHSDRRAEDLRPARDGKFVPMQVRAVGEVLVRVLGRQGNRVVVQMVVTLARPVGFPKSAQILYSDGILPVGGNDVARERVRVIVLPSAEVCVDDGS